MANALAGGTETPPVNNPAMGNALISGAAPQPQAPQHMPTPPTHAQTVAALRHFDAIRKELGIIAKDPALGKSSVKGKIIDGVTRLVADRFMKPAEAVQQLSTVPTEPLLQLKWIKAMLQQSVQAEQAILSHHAIGFAGGGPEAAPSMDDHDSHMSAVMSGFQGANRG